MVIRFRKRRGEHLRRCCRNACLGCIASEVSPNVGRRNRNRHSIRCVGRHACIRRAGLTIRSSGPLRRVRGNLRPHVAAATYLKR